MRDLNVSIIAYSRPLKELCGARLGLSVRETTTKKHHHQLKETARAASTVLEKIRKLDEEKSKLISAAKTEALQNAKAAVEELNSLGFSYRLVEGSEAAPIGTTTRRRRSNIRDEVLAAVKKAGSNGSSRADLLGKLGVKGDKSGEQSVSNALSALKKAGTISQKDGQYVAA